MSRRISPDADPSSVLDWRYGDDLLEFATRGFFDRREVVLATFEVGEVLAEIGARHDIGHEKSLDRLSRVVRLV